MHWAHEGAHLAGPRSVRTIDVPDPEILEPTDAIVRITSTAICGSDLHLLDVLGPFLHKGDVLGHEPMGVVVETGSAVSKISIGDRVVIPFVIACGECYQCRRGFTTQCERTRTPGQDTGASLYGYTELYGSVPGGQAEYLRVRLADANAMRITTDLPDERYLFLSDILPTAWQGCSTRTFRRAARSPCSASAPSGSWSPASAATSATT
ncbi:hypothetical protein GCM10025881_13780 [Pseudolysinimonas kribbensis]|uniref:Alcohol dehydrogenase-like N-terminal domain-containing protein n=1 Tax=Pseudolysinimonas kribbensis TaxID=433641 RepID=A0ABQ6K554_9MICO|nr:hypothetical protein GCM10025881_13780 [Pseudolysinimonas kribbensis]